MYFLVSGRVEFFTTNDAGEEVLLEMVGPGAFFGEVALLTGGARTASARAVEDVVALELPKERLPELLTRYPDLTRQLMEQMAQRLARSGRQLRQLDVRNVNALVEQEATRSDGFFRVLTLGIGSTPCLVLTGAAIVLWMLKKPFADAQLSLLSLVLSVVSLLVTLVVLNNQGRQDKASRTRNDVEFQANVQTKAELTYLHRKVDELSSRLPDTIERPK